jgi:pterin-4a-carbinolamine dehydratase
MKGKARKATINEWAINNNNKKLQKMFCFKGFKESKL